MATLDRYSSIGADIKVQRSRFPMSRVDSLSMMHGYMHPVGEPIEVLPGDTWKVNISAFTRMSNPILPFIGNIRQEVDVFFVPKRILWNKTKQFYGEAPSFGIASPVTEPYSASFTAYAVTSNLLDTNALKSDSIAAAFDLVYDDYTDLDPIPLNVLPVRAFLACYNEFYRDENYQAPYVWDKDETGHISGNYASRNGVNCTGTTMLPKVNKDRDVVTSVLPYQIKGNPVALSIGGKVPVVTGDINTALVTEETMTYKLKSGVNPIKFGAAQSETGDISGYSQLGIFKGTNTAKGNGTALQTSASNDLGSVAPINLYADLGSSVSASISDLLYSLAYQDFLARAAHFGTRYREYIFSMFGTVIADATEDIPEYLGRLKFNINVQQVVQTTGFVQSSSTELGALGAYSSSGNSGKVFTKSFTEPGYLIFITYTKHQRTYSTGVDRVFLKKELLDYYQPPFANIADVPYNSLNVWLANNSGVEGVALGFQEPWYEYHALHDRVHGMLNPKIDSLGELWTLAEKWSQQPVIGNIIEEDRAVIKRVLSTGNNGPDYLCDFEISADVTRVMPLYASGRLGKF